MPVTPASPFRLPRGVHTTPYLSSDCRPMMVAIDSRNCMLADRSYRDEADERVQRAWLWALLDSSDPVPAPGVVPIMSLLG